MQNTLATAEALLVLNVEAEVLTLRVPSLALEPIKHPLKAQPFS